MSRYNVGDRVAAWIPIHGWHIVLIVATKVVNRVRLYEVYWSGPLQSIRLWVDRVYKPKIRECKP